jgi:uncharacterized protein (DUF305 family)
VADASAPRVGSRPLLVAVAVLGIALGAVTVHHLSSGHGEPTADLPAPAGEAAVPATAADIGFLQDMSDHHAQAVLMADHAVRHADADQVRTLAANIVSDQAFERGTMAAYLTDRGGTDGDPGRQAMAWMGHPVPLDEMPGLIPASDLAALLGLDGPELDRRFLQLMIEHHEGGVDMAAAALRFVSDPAVRSLAGQMVVAQEEEIADMAALLGAPAR